MTSTAVELHEVPGSIVAPTSAQRNSSDDDVLIASQAADASVPDGGSGWLVIFGCAVLTWWFGGTSYSWGIIQAALVEKGLSSASTLSYIGSIGFACVSFMAIINARIVRLIGAQKTGMLGVVLMSAAEILSSFSVGNVTGLFFTSGLMLGVGFSLCFITVSVTPAQYFSRKRGLANGIVFAGGGLGGAVTSIAVDSLILKIGTPWTYRVLGIATLLTGVPAAWLVKERVPPRPTAFIEWYVLHALRTVIVNLAKW